MSKLHYELIAATDEHADNLEAFLGADGELTEEERAQVLEARSLYGLAEWARVCILKGFRVASGGAWDRKMQLQEREARSVYERYSPHLPHRKKEAPAGQAGASVESEDASSAA